MKRPGVLGVRWLFAAAAVGLVHAGFSLYWALGGRWLLPTVGSWAVHLAQTRAAAAGAARWDPLFLLWGLLLAAGLAMTRSRAAQRWRMAA